MLHLPTAQAGPARPSPSSTPIFFCLARFRRCQPSRISGRRVVGSQTQLRRGEQVRGAQGAAARRGEGTRSAAQPRVSSRTLGTPIRGSPIQTGARPAAPPVPAPAHARPIARPPQHVGLPAAPGGGRGAAPQALHRAADAARALGESGSRQLRPRRLLSAAALMPPGAAACTRGGHGARGPLSARPGALQNPIWAPRATGRRPAAAVWHPPACPLSYIHATHSRTHADASRRSSWDGGESRHSLAAL